MANIKIGAEKRTEFGKGPSRRARVNGQVPAVIYGKDQEPLHILVDAHEMLLALKRPNAIFELTADNTPVTAIAREVQRHPYKPIIEHIDFLAIAAGEKITVDVPIVVVGEPAPNTLLIRETHTLSVLVDATKIPESITIDVDGKEAGLHLTAGDLPLPEGVELDDKVDLDILSIAAQKQQSLEDETAESTETVASTEGESAEAES
jgi:large subunit ribosomal protein L25